MGEEANALSKEDIEAVLHPIVLGHLRWYIGTSARLDWTLAGLTVLAVGGSVVTAAAVTNPFASFGFSSPHDQNFMKGVAAISSVVTAFASAFRASGGLLATAQAREQGRVEVLAVAESARNHLKCPMTLIERAEYLDTVIEKVRKIELDFGRHRYGVNADAKAAGTKATGG